MLFAGTFGLLTVYSSSARLPRALFECQFEVHNVAAAENGLKLFISVSITIGHTPPACESFDEGRL